MSTDTPTSRARRRQTVVRRNLDDTLRISNLLSWKGAQYVALFYGVVHLVGTGTPFLAWLVGKPFVFLVELALTVIAGIALSWAERREDEHWVPSAIEYYLDRPWTHVYSGACPPPRTTTLKDILERAA